MNRAGLWNPIETRKALLIGVANQRFTTLARGCDAGLGSFFLGAACKYSLRPALYRLATGKITVSDSGTEEMG